MSMLAQVDATLSPAANVAAFALLILGPLASFGIARSIGVFREPGIVGPDRLKPGEPVLPLLGVLFFAIAVYVLIPSIYLQMSRADLPARSTPTTLPSTAPSTAPSTLPAAPAQTINGFTPRQLVTVNALGGTGALLVLLFGNLLFRREGLTSIGLHPSHVPQGLLWGCVGIVFVIPLITWVSVGSAKVWEWTGLEHPQKHEMLEILDTAEPVLSWLIILSAAVLAPLYEELLFRGHLQTALTTLFTRARARGQAPPADVSPQPAEPSALPQVAMPTPVLAAPVPESSIVEYHGPTPDWPRLATARWIAVIVTSLMFAVVHPWWTIPPIFFLSLCLGFFYERTGNLYVPIAIHALFNTLSILLSRYVMQ